MIELKWEVNDLLHSVGRQEKYRVPTWENVKNKKKGKNGRKRQRNMGRGKQIVSW